MNLLYIRYKSKSFSVDYVKPEKKWSLGSVKFTCKSTKRKVRRD